MKLTELLTSCLAMFLFKSKSRNGFNNLREDLRFEKNYQLPFKMRLPHADTVDQVIRLLKTEQIEHLKQKMVKVLIRRKVFHKQRYREQWYCITIDVKHHTSWFHNVLEARLVTGGT